MDHRGTGSTVQRSGPLDGVPGQSMKRLLKSWPRRLAGVAEKQLPRSRGKFH